MISKLYTSALLLLVTCGLQAQNTIGVTEFQPDLVDDGYTLLYPHNQPNVYLLDFCGEVVHTWTNADTLRPGNVAYLQENGDIVFDLPPSDLLGGPHLGRGWRRHGRATDVGQRRAVVVHPERQHRTFAPRH